MTTNLDILRKEVAVGDVVAACHHNSLHLYTVDKISSKMLGLKRIVKEGQRDSGLTYKYGTQCVLVDSADVTMFLLTHG